MTLQFKKVGQLNVAEMPNGDVFIPLPFLRTSKPERLLPRKLLKRGEIHDESYSRNVRKTTVRGRVVFLKPILLGVGHAGGEPPRYNAVHEAQVLATLVKGGPRYGLTAERPLALYLFKTRRLLLASRPTQGDTIHAGWLVTSELKGKRVSKQDFPALETRINEALKKLGLVAPGGVIPSGHVRLCGKRRLLGLLDVEDYQKLR